jgi:hypothetical protein
MRTHDECNEFSRSCVKKETLRRRRRRNNNQQVKKKGPWTLRDLLWMCAHGKVISRRSDWRARFAKKSTKSVGMELLFFSTFICACSPFSGFGILFYVDSFAFALKSAISRACSGAHGQPKSVRRKSPTPATSHLSEKLSGWWYPCRERSPRATLSRVTRLDKRFADFVDSNSRNHGVALPNCVFYFLW